MILQEDCQQKYKKSKKIKNGKVEGIIRVLAKRKCSDDEIIDELQNELDIDSGKAADYLKKFYEGMF